MNNEYQEQNKSLGPKTSIGVAMPQHQQAQNLPQSVGKGRPVDVVYVVDATESMTPYIQGVRAALKSGIDALISYGLKVMLGLIVFRDELMGDMPEITPLGAPPILIKQTLDSCIARDGGDVPESSLKAIKRAIEMPGQRGKAQRVLLLVTDAPPHDPEGDLTSAHVSALLKQHRALLFACAPPIEPFTTLVNQTGGILYPIRRDLNETSFKDMLASLAEHTHVTLTALADAELAEHARKAARNTIIYS